MILKFDKRKYRRRYVSPHPLLFILAVGLLSQDASCLRINSLNELQKDSSSITIEWAVSEANATRAGSDWVGFKIKYFTEKLQYTPILLKNILIRKFRLDNLKANTVYKIQVSAYQSIGTEGPASRLLSVRTFETVPGEPQDFKLVKVTSDSIEIEWKPPRQDDASASSNVKGYEIHYFKVIEASSDPSIQNQETQIFKKKLPYKKLKHKLTKLEPNSLYKIQIFAYNMKGDGQRSKQLLVQTMDEGPNKPENIRSEIYNNLLHIKWSPPKVKSSGKFPMPVTLARQKVAGYKLYFNNEKYEVDDQTMQITFPRPKWDYDRQYDFRIAAKSIQSDNAIYGQEAVFRISTFTNQSKIAITVDKLTSTSAVIRWNNISFSSFTDSSSAEADIGPSASTKSKRIHYKFSYGLKSDSNNLVTYEELVKNEIKLKNLLPNSDYIIQIVAFGSDRNRPMTSEIALKHFRTLIDDIKVPGNLQVTRFTYDKLKIKWEPVVLYDPSKPNKNFNLIKGYKVFYKEILPKTASEENDYRDEDSFGEMNQNEWTGIEAINGDWNTEMNLEDLNINSDYAIKVAAVDHFDNQGPESEVKIAYSLIDSSNQMKPSFESAKPSQTYTINKEIGQPRDVKTTQSTMLIRFTWKPPNQAPSSYTIKKFLITVVDHKKEYRESNGTIVTYHNGVTMTYDVPARDDPTLEITWSISSLLPDTFYDIEISALSDNNQQGLPVKKTIKTKRDRPYRVDRPTVEDVYQDNTVLIRTGNASEKNGPISKYWLVVTPLEDQNKKGMQLINNYETQENNIRNLLQYSIYNKSNNKESNKYANESAYIAAEFESQHWPARFIIGDGRLYGRFFNRRLVSNFVYRTYIIAFTDELSQQPLDSKRLNRVGLGHVIQSAHAFTEGNLYTSSQYSDLFSIVPGWVSNPINVGFFRIKDPQALLWAFGLIICAVLVLIILCCVQFKKRTKSAAYNNTTTTNNNTILLNGRGTSSTMSSNLNSRQLETQATLKNGSIMTNTLKAGGITKHTINLQNGTTPSHQATVTASSSSSSSSTTASPTTALLSCSVNNNSNNNVCGSQNSNNTNNTQVNSSIVLNNNGLLTTASPLRTINNTSSPIANSSNMLINPSESLYTSIEVTQKLLQQQLLSNTSNPYDNNNQQLMMMMLNGQNTFNTATTGTLSRNTNTLSVSHYDPIELRRIQYQTPAMQTHPPVNIDELPQHIERLKAQANAKFSLEYESIEPGQQFQWEHSTIEHNRQKNRYANVIAYDHSRVCLIKLPEHYFTQTCNQSTYSGYTSACNTLQRGAYSSESNYGTLRGGCDGSMGLVGTPPLPPPPPPPPGIQNSSPEIQAVTSDYINANYMDGYRKRNAYIATQGPLPSTIGDFWRMIWEQQTCTIVMMTKLEERNRLKCDQYWPNKGTEVYANCVQVTLVDVAELSTYTVRTFVISPVNTYAQIQITNNSNNMNYELRREVKHYQYTAWPDHGVPDHPTSFLMFIRRVRNSNPVDSGPIVAHCSAGVGRTGCYVVIDTMLQRIRNERSIDVYGHVTCLRSQRNYMVQTEDQYVFCYEALLEAMQSGHTEVLARNLYQHLQRLLQISPEDPNSMLTEMELEYKRLSSIKAPQSKFQSANLASNKFKNRLVNILPYEATRVCLQHLPNTAESSGSDYINANFIDGYKYKKAYIATQAPLNETIDDFWRMLWEHNSTIIVMLTKLREMGREKCAQYWPSERSIRYQYFVVDPIAEYNMSQYILREFKVTDARDGQSRTIRQFQFVDWPEQGVPKSGESIIELIGQVHKTKEQFGQTGPITVHCSAGVGRTGVFITLGIVLERTRFEGMIDVFNTVKILRTQRPAMVQTEDQYQFCYRAALEYLGSYDTYE